MSVSIVTQFLTSYTLAHLHIVAHKHKWPPLTHGGQVDSGQKN